MFLYFYPPRIFQKCNEAPTDDMMGRQCSRRGRKGRKGRKGREKCPSRRGRKGRKGRKKCPSRVNSARHDTQLRLQHIFGSRQDQVGLGCDGPSLNLPIQKSGFIGVGFLSTVSTISTISTSSPFLPLGSGLYRSHLRRDATPWKAPQTTPVMGKVWFGSCA